MLLLLWLSMAAAYRPFALMDPQQALRLMEHGFLDVQRPKALELASRLASSVNGAVREIRQALIDSGVNEVPGNE